MADRPPDKPPVEMQSPDQWWGTTKSVKVQGHLDVAGVLVQNFGRFSWRSTSATQILAITGRELSKIRGAIGTNNQAALQLLTDLLSTLKSLMEQLEIELRQDFALYNEYAAASAVVAQIDEAFKAATATATAAKAKGT